jgi:uncharacterized protein YbbC (DUF1343 family)
MRFILNLAVGATVVASPLAVPAQSSAAARVKVGADRLFTEYAHLLEGKRLALVSNHSGRLADGTHLADALHRHKGAELKVLFGMEYDIRSNDYSVARDGESAVDRGTGLVKHNLYGEHHKPTREMLSGVDAIVFDIQEVGARFYEHINILGFVMEAAAENEIEVIVLDRPNPITGEKVDGFITDESSLYRFGSYARVPVVHGMTMGELARFYNEEGELRGRGKVKLTVVPMEGWKRSMWYDETGLPWSKPSPNLLTFHSLLAYIGTCLVEATNLSEGRGSDRPFEYIGAAWLDNDSAVKLLNDLSLDGVTFEKIAFTPEQKPFHGRPPKLTGVPLQGIYVRVTNRNVFDPYRAGVSILWAVHKLHRDKLVWNDAALDRLTATPRLKLLIAAGSTPDEIFAAWGPELEAFKARRAPHLLYQ